MGRFNVVKIVLFLSTEVVIKLRVTQRIIILTKYSKAVGKQALLLEKNFTRRGSMRINYVAE